MRPRRVTSLLAVLLLFTLPAAGADRWTRVGPDTASVEALGASPARPSTVYAGLSLGGVYRSTDAGQTWDWASAGLDSHGPVYHLAVAPASPDTVYAVVGGRSLHKTTTGGRSWQRLLDPEEISLAVREVAVHPRDGRIVYALSQEGRVRRSTDGGISWTDLPGAPENTHSLRIDPVRPNILYAAVINGPLWKSTDEGQTWRQISEGLGPAPRIQSFEIHPKSPQILYTTLWNDGPSLFQSKNGGETWAPLARELRNASLDLLGAVPRGAQLTLFGTVSGSAGRRLYRSLDGGLSWSEAGKGLRAPLFGISPVTATSGAVLVPTSEGVFRSADGGRSWAPSSRDLQEHRIAGLARGSAQEAGIYVVVPKQGIYENAGRQDGWRLLPADNKLTESFYGPLAAHPRQPGRLYAGTLQGIARSEDRGATWELSDVVCLFTQEIVTDPLNPDTLYITGQPRSSASCQSSSGTPACSLYKSEDGGRTFTCSQSGLPEEYFGLLTVDPRQPSNLLVRAAEDLYRSTDGGISWSFLASFSAPDRLLRALAFDPRDSNRVYAGIRGGVSRSTDGGLTWTPATAGLPRDAVIDLEIDPVDTKTLYALASRSGVFKSTDAGETWRPVGTGLAGLFAKALLLDPRDRSALYVQTLEDGLLRLTQSAP